MGSLNLGGFDFPARRFQNFKMAVSFSNSKKKINDRQFDLKH